MAAWSKEIRIVSTLVREAGKKIMELYKNTYAIRMKGKNDPVTQADQQANALLFEGLHSNFPNDDIVTEESPLPSNMVGKGRIWYVDPLDGTKEFIAGNDEFSVMIGLTIHGHAKLGVVYSPVEDLLYVGITDQSAWVEYEGTRQLLKAYTSINPPHIRMITSRSHRSPVLASIQQNLSIENEQQMGSVGLKIAQIAQGRADVYIEPGPFTKAWDACAPEAILRGAGGIFTDMHGNSIQYGFNNFHNLHGLVGSTQDCHHRVIHALTGLCSSCEG